jgi:threonine dehydratase
MNVTRNAIEVAAQRIASHIRRTPMLWLQDGLALKLELLQMSGSFKARGAFNRMLSAALPAAGVVAASGGNHGAAVAHAAQALGVPAAIFVPEITGTAKRARIEAAGARLVVGGGAYDEARQASERHAAATGTLMVHAYDQAEVLAGQGTLALEMQQDAPGLTHVLVAVGGGGLIGGVAAWYAGSGTQVVAVEPEGCPTLHRALAAGQPVPAPVGGLAADSLGARQVGSLMFPIAQRAWRQVCWYPTKRSAPRDAGYGRNAGWWRNRAAPRRWRRCIRVPGRHRRGRGLAW